jgi:hypothetical protein
VEIQKIPEGLPVPCRVNKISERQMSSSPVLREPRVLLRLNGWLRWLSIIIRFMIERRWKLERKTDGITFSEYWGVGVSFWTR